MKDKYKATNGKIYSRRKFYLFKVSMGNWDKDVFDPNVSEITVSAWDAISAVRKVKNNIEMDNGEIITSVEFLGYKQL